MADERRRAWDPVTIVLVGALLVGALAMGFIEAGGPQLLPPGEAAPAFVLARTSGERVSSAELGGRVTMLAFWASWCGPCREELPMLVRTAQAEGVSLLAINTDDRFDQRDAVRRFVEDVPGVGPYVLLGEPAVGEAYRVRVLPTLYIVGRDARIASAQSGVVEEAQLRRWLREAGSAAR